ncbi:MAG: WG repeat-containing protein [Chitinophagaceae bacterium]|nr:WG repeat-containing protein [Chitinophagaceae bacterium]
MKIIITTLLICLWGAGIYAQDLKPFKGENSKYGYKDATEKIVIIPKYDDVDKFSDGFAKVALNDKIGLINQKGKEIVSPKYDAIGNFSYGMAAVVLNNKLGFINTTGKEIVQMKYDLYELCSKDDYKFSEGLASVSILDGDNYYLDVYKWGFIDKTGKEIIPLKYESVESFKNGKAKVYLDFREFYIDKTGKEVK